MTSLRSSILLLRLAALLVTASAVANEDADNSRLVVLHDALPPSGDQNAVRRNEVQGSSAIAGHPNTAVWPEKKNNHVGELERYGEAKKSMGLLRLGRGGGGGLKAEAEKKAMGMLRLGRTSVRSEDEEGDYRNWKNEDKKSMGLLRLGRKRDDGSEERLREWQSPAAGADEQDKRAMGMLRLGRGERLTGNLRPMEFEEDVENGSKRAMGMLRLGRQSPAVQRRKTMSMLRLGRKADSAAAQELDDEGVKRAMGMLRLG